MHSNLDYHQTLHLYRYFTQDTRSTLTLPIFNWLHKTGIFFFGEWNIFKLVFSRLSVSLLVINQSHRSAIIISIVIKSVRFQYSKLSKMVKMIHNSISDACTVAFVSNLAVQSLAFDQNYVQTWQNNFASSTMAIWPWPCFHFQLHALVSHPKWGVKWQQSSKWYFSNNNLWI